MSFTSLKLTPSAVPNIGCGGKLPNLDFRSSPQRTVDVPWESAWRLESRALTPAWRPKSIPEHTAFIVMYPATPTSLACPTERGLVCALQVQANAGGDEITNAQEFCVLLPTLAFKKLLKISRRAIPVNAHKGYTLYQTIAARNPLRCHSHGNCALLRRRKHPPSL